jgi:hypothetical protein
MHSGTRRDISYLTGKGTKGEQRKYYEGILKVLQVLKL